MYEFNRAIARIALEQAANIDRSTDATKDAILTDLRKAVHDDWIRGRVMVEPEFKAWADRNGVALRDL